MFELCLSNLEIWKVSRQRSNSSSYQGNTYILNGVTEARESLASSQALPALKVALDDECSGKGLVRG